MITLNKNSWHYRLATEYGGYTTYDGQDICTYTKSIIGSLVVIAFCLLLFSFFSMLIIHFGLGIVFSFITGTLFFSEMGWAAFAIFIVFGGGAASLWIIFYLRDRRREQIERDGLLDHDGFLKHAYRSWKEKYCVRISFE
jgi:hypothetical protein